MPIRPQHALLLLATALTLGACGTKGPLTMPPPPRTPTTAAPATPQPQRQEAADPTHLITPKESAR